MIGNVALSPSQCLFYSGLFVYVSNVMEDCWYIKLVCYSGSAVVVEVAVEREDEVSGPVIAPFFPQVSLSL